MEAEPRLLTVNQAAAVLGISSKSVYKLLAAKELRGVRILRDIRIPTTDVDELIERKLRETSAPQQSFVSQPAA